MNNWNDQFYMTHSFTTHFFLCNFYTTTVANDIFITDTLILSTITFIVLDRSKYFLAEKTISFGLIRPVIDGFRLQNFTIRSLKYLIRGAQAD